MIVKTIEIFAIQYYSTLPNSFVVYGIFSMFVTFSDNAQYTIALFERPMVM